MKLMTMAANLVLFFMFIALLFSVGLNKKAL
jgi:hypothetical protein